MLSFSYLSTFPPTRCGLASFTASLAGALTAECGTDARVVQMTDELARPQAPTPDTGVRIVGELSSAETATGPAVRAAARALSRSDVAVVQHEYGIFGGTDGADVIGVLEQLDVPSIVVLHTVLDAPSAGQRAVLERVAALADAVVVMTASALLRLEHHYAVDHHKVSLVPHGVATATLNPNPTLGGPLRHRHPRADRRTLLTWGLIGPGKGIEHGIGAVALLGSPTPAIHYVVAGQTHPKVLARDGEAYRESLRALAEELGVADRVHLEGGYLDAASLADRVAEADLVLLPYDSRNQVTSGVLVEAVGAGKPVVATAFPHAVEVLTERTGVVVAHEDPAAMAVGIQTVLARLDAHDRPTPEPEPGDLGPTGRSWTDVARQYRELAVRLTTGALDTPDGDTDAGPGAAPVTAPVRLSL